MVGGLVWGTVDETPQAGDGVGTHQDVTTKRTTVHHSDVERRVEQLILWEVLE